MAASDIIKSCNSNFFSVPHDCNAFLKAVALDSFNAQPFAGNADAIIASLRTAGNGWTDLNGDISSAITHAKSGEFVVAGMTSGELGDTNGHVAVVAGVDGKMSGTVIVPIGFARSLADTNLPQNQIGPHEVQKGRLSGTFPADDVRNGNVSYYSKLPDKFLATALSATNLRAK